MAMYDYRMLFRCPQCDWWAVGTHSSERPIAEDKLAEVRFDVQCILKKCGWTARLLGREAHQRLGQVAAQ
jgi:hypothetical protein